jgi:hypothetical protein
MKLEREILGGGGQEISFLEEESKWAWQKFDLNSIGC